MDQLIRNPHWSVAPLRMSLLLKILKLLVATMLLEVDSVVVRVEVVAVIAVVGVVVTMVMVVVVVAVLNPQTNMVV